MKRTHRLFAIAEYLRGRRTGVTVAELSERFEVSERTMFRDLEALRDAALPVQGERGRGGGVALDRSYSLPPVNFSPREAALLVAIGRYVADMRVLPFTATLDAALDKVRAALSTSAQRQLLQHVETLHFIGVPARTASPDVRHALEEAWFTGEPLRIRYAGSRETTTRTVKVESVVMERSETLVNAFDLEKKEQRQFKLEHIEEAVLARDAPPAPEDGAARPASVALHQVKVRRPRDR